MRAEDADVEGPMRNAWAHVSRRQHRVVTAAIRQAFDHADQTAEQRSEAPRRCYRDIPNEASIMRLIGAVPFERNDEWETVTG